MVDRVTVDIDMLKTLLSQMEQEVFEGAAVTPYTEGRIDGMNRAARMLERLIKREESAHKVNGKNT